MVPIDWPGDSVPPLPMTVVGKMPVPPTNVPEFTVNRLDAPIEPLTIGAPSLTVVAPVYALAPDNVSVPVPTLVSEPPSPEIPPLTSVERLLLPTVSALPPRI